MKETHHYDHHNTFWDRARAQQNNNTHCLKQFYVSLNDEYEYALKWKIHDTLSRLGSSENTFTQVYVYEPETIKLNTDHYFIEQYNRQRAPQKKISRCLLASWNLDQNLGETYEYALKWKINLHRFRSSEGTLTYVCVYDHETIKLNTDH